MFELQWNLTYPWRTGLRHCRISENAGYVKRALYRIWKRIYSPKLEYAHVMRDIIRGYPTNEDKIFTAFVRKKKRNNKTKVMHPLALALTQTFPLNHLSKKQLRSSHSLYSLINSSATDLRTGENLFTQIGVHSRDVWHLQGLSNQRRQDFHHIL